MLIYHLNLEVYSKFTQTLFLGARLLETTAKSTLINIIKKFKISVSQKVFLNGYL